MGNDQEVKITLPVVAQPFFSHSCEMQVALVQGLMVIVHVHLLQLSTMMLWISQVEKPFQQ